MELPKRKHPRLRTYDYSQNGVYFITICTLNRAELLCAINTVKCTDYVERANAAGRADPNPPSPLSQPEVSLTKYGEIAKSFIETIPQYYNATVDVYVIMPNHVHLLLYVENENALELSRQSMTIPKIIKAFKRITTQQIGFDLWQESYYDHIIRDEKDHIAKWDYINNNPAKWADDDYYPQ